MTEYVEGARYRVTLEGEWNGRYIDVREGTAGRPGCALYDNSLSAASSVEKIADPTPEWLPGDKVLRNKSVAVYTGDDYWEVLYDAGNTMRCRTATTVYDGVTVLVKQGKRVVQ